MQIKDPNYWKRIAKANAKTIDSILWFGLLSSITILGLSFSKDNAITIVGVKLPLQYAWVPLTIFTGLHLIYTLRFEAASRNFWTLTEPVEYSELFKDITSEGGYFMREMKPRILPETGGPAPMGNDLSTWLTHLTALILFIALFRTVKFDTDITWIRLSSIVIPFGLMYINWIIGSRWAIVLSELAVKKKYSTILSRKRREFNPSTIIIQRETPTVFDEDQPDKAGDEIQ